ncbi:MAG: heme lyase CcmF/NrfE family subunit, partial [candidate division KSB1 bacterium]|nr:heme lyase CcmF/NrfE family subunit [candidate division KSB1 bacterium]
MTDIGYPALLIAFIIAFYSAWFSILGSRLKNRSWIHRTQRGAYVVFILITVAVLALIWALLSRDFQIRYVAEYSSRDLPLSYTISAFWAGQAGSLLLWAWLLALLTVIVVYQHRQKAEDEFIPYVVTITQFTTFFFLMLLIFAANPFEKLPFRPQDGQGLNPLLQNPEMIFHPPTLYLGFVGFAIPFALALAALITGRLDAPWLRTTRRWTLFAWLFLTIGNILGAQWAYVELGWGGYWAWDPVENASLMPWLTGTAFLHSLIIQEKKGMFKIWSMVLIILTFMLTIFGTFITRSGILSSVHSFGASNLGTLFLIFLGLVLGVALFLLFYRIKKLKGEYPLEHLISRESSFLLNNIIFVGLAFVVFWGTIYPIISEVFTGDKITLGPAFFNKAITPIGLILILLTGICPLLGWRKAMIKNLIKNLSYPLSFSLVAMVVLYVLGVRNRYAWLYFSFSILVVVTILLELRNGTVARRRQSGESWLKALWNLITGNRRRYAGYLVHIGVIMLIVGITGSSAFKIEQIATLQKGESLNIGSYELTYEGLSHHQEKNKLVVAANLLVRNQGKEIGRLRPEVNFHRHNQQASEVAIRSTLKEDLYVILAEYDEDGTATFKAIINALVLWMWIGGGIMALGAVIALWPESRQKKTTGEKQGEAIRKSGMANLKDSLKKQKALEEKIEQEILEVRKSLATKTGKIKSCCHNCGSEVDRED